jgi:hypothetical protein
MIAFACAVTDTEAYERFAAPGLELAAEPDSAILTHGSVGSIAGNPAGSIFGNYNMFLDQAAALDGLEALVLVHQDTEIVDPAFCATVREALADPAVAIVGCVGAVGVRNIAYWEGSVTWASFTHRYWEHGGGEFPGLSWAVGGPPTPYARTGEVDTIDGFLIVLSPWAIQELRFDESLGQIHGYDFDICCQARAAGKKVVTADLQVIHHHSLRLVDDTEAWIEAYIKTVEKWGETIPAAGAGAGDWEQRARRAEAEAAAARIQVGEGRLLSAAQIRRIEVLEGELDSVRRSPSWRLTAPLRALKRRAGSE